MGAALTPRGSETTCVKVPVSQAVSFVAVPFVTNSKWHLVDAQLFHPHDRMNHAKGSLMGSLCTAVRALLSPLSCVTAAMIGSCSTVDGSRARSHRGSRPRTVEIPGLSGHTDIHVPYAQPCRTHSTHQPHPLLPRHVSPLIFKAQLDSSGSRVDLESWAQFTVLSFVSVAPRGPEGASVHDIE